MTRPFVSFIIIFLTIIIGSLTHWSWDQLKLTPEHKTLLRLSLDNGIDDLDPAKAYSDDALIVSAQVLEPLYQYHYLKRPYEVQPLLAEGMPQVSENGLLLKIKINKDAFYHPHEVLPKGRKVVAQDFINQFKRLALPSLKSAGRSVFSGLIIGFDEFATAVNDDWKNINKFEISGLKAIDDYTLTIRLSTPEPNMMYYLALNFIVPIPWELIKFYKNNLSKSMIGTGPYVYKGFNGDYFEMHRFTSYREEYYPTSGDRYANVQKLLDSSKERLPFIDQVRFYITSSEEARWEKFMKQELDLLTVPKTYIPQLYDSNGQMNSELQSLGAQLKHFPILANRWLGFNMRDPIVGKNDFLRRAIAYGIDYNRYIQVISQNTNLRANSVLVPGIAGYLPAKDFRFNFNPDLARAYLKNGGFDRPEKMPTLIYSTRGNQAIHLKEAELIKEMLGEIGLKVQIQVLSFAEFLSKGRAGELMFFTDNWLFDYPDGENILQLLVSTNFPGVNKSGYSNPQMDKLYEELKQTAAFDTRDRIIHEMEEIIFKDLPWIPLMYESSFVLHYPELKNFRKSSIIRNYVKYLKIAE